MCFGLLCFQSLHGEMVSSPASKWIERVNDFIEISSEASHPGWILSLQLSKGEFLNNNLSFGWLDCLDRGKCHMPKFITSMSEDDMEITHSRYGWHVMYVTHPPRNKELSLQIDYEDSASHSVNFSMPPVLTNTPRDTSSSSAPTVTLLFHEITSPLRNSDWSRAESQKIFRLRQEPLIQWQL